MQRESELLNAILLKYGSLPDVRIFRNNVGVLPEETVTTTHLARVIGMLNNGRIDDSLALLGALLGAPKRYVRYGLCVGSSDLIGWVSPVWIDQGARAPVARFLALECKTATGRVTKEQQQFLDIVNAHGGVGRVVRTEEQAGDAIEEARRT